MFELLHKKEEPAQGFWQRTLAGRFVTSAQSWTRHLTEVYDLPKDGTQMRLMNEMMAYGVGLLAIQHRQIDGTIQVDPYFQSCLKEAYDEVTRAMQSYPAAMKPVHGHSSPFGLSLAPYMAKTLSDTGITEESLRLFHLATGLDASALVGGGSNLATLVFYIVLFSMLINPQAPANQRNVDILNDIKACADHLREMIAQVPEQSGGIRFLTDPAGDTASLGCALNDKARHNQFIINNITS